MEWSEFLARVQEQGQYATTAEAERVTRIVLSALGGHLARPERDELAACLPSEARRVLTDQLEVTRPLPAAEFVDTLVLRLEGATAATARWDASSVLGTLAEVVDTPLLNRLIAKLPPGWALLFGRAQLAGCTA